MDRSVTQRKGTASRQFNRWIFSIFVIGFLTVSPVISADEVSAIHWEDVAMQSLQKGMLGSAERAWWRASMAAPERLEPRMALIDLYIAQGRYTVAERLIAEAMSSDQAILPLLARKARLIERRDGLVAAEEVYTQISKHSVNDIEIVRQAEQYFERSGQTERAQGMKLQRGRLQRSTAR